MKNSPFIGLQHRQDITPFNEDEVRFEIDMCIGCDRCMRACPIPLSSMVSIASLNLATVSSEIAPHVARFAQECVMCGSCVPVCPVNNHRDLLMLSLKQRLGIPWDGTIDPSRVLDYLPQGWDLPLLLNRVREQPAFHDPKLVPENYLLHFLASSKVLSLPPDSTILIEGQYGRETYFILEGHVEISSLGPGGKNLPIAILRRGEIMGERGMLTGQPRNATARTQTHAVILEVPEQVMQRMMEIVPAIHDYFEHRNNERSITSVLKRLPLFQGIQENDMQWIAQVLQFKTYDRDETLFAQHQSKTQDAHRFLVILEGFVKITHKTLASTGQNVINERIIAYRQSGDYFTNGLDLLGNGEPVTATAINRVRVAELPPATMQLVLNRYPTINQYFQQRLHDYYSSAAAAQTFIGSLDLLRTRTTPSLATDPTSSQHTSTAARQGLRALVGGGVVEGTEVLVIDLDKCVQCDKCEQACELRHGHSRMNRTGMVVGNISIATACRQCQDPICMLCSRAGIARMPSGEVYITESCIGCGICAERCPYDNISIITLTEETQERSLWQKFNTFMHKGTGQERGKKLLPVLNNTAAPGPLNPQQPLDALGEMRKKLAIKCDLCTGYNNQACIQACPTGAAFRVQPTQFFGSTEDILQQNTYSKH